MPSRALSEPRCSWMPAAHPQADFPELRAEKGIRYRLVNFVEVTAPLFRTDKLFEFVHEYVPRRHDPAMLVGYGVDCWMCQRLLKIADQSGDCAHPDKAAVVDSVPFVNPSNSSKCGVREIDTLRPFNARVDDWEQLCKVRGLLTSYKFRTFHRVPV